jgi:hypothetical protein
MNTHVKNMIGDEVQRGLGLIARAKAAFTKRTTYLRPTDGMVIPFRHRAKQYYQIDLSGPCLDCEICHTQHYATYIYSPHGDRLRLSQYHDLGRDVVCNRIVP